MSGLEAVGTVASIVQLAELGLSLAQKLYQLAKDIRSFSKRITRLARRVESNKRLLDRLRDSVETNGTRGIPFSQPLKDDIETAIAYCRDVFSDVGSACQAASADTQMPQFLRKAKFSLFEKTQVEQLHVELNQCQTEVNLILTVHWRSDAVEMHQQLLDAIAKNQLSSQTSRVPSVANAVDELLKQNASSQQDQSGRGKGKIRVQQDVGKDDKLGAAPIARDFGSGNDAGSQARVNTWRTPSRPQSLRSTQASPTPSNAREPSIPTRKNKSRRESDNSEGIYQLIESSTSDDDLHSPAPVALPVALPPFITIKVAWVGFPGTSRFRTYWKFHEVPSANSSYDYYDKSLLDAISSLDEKSTIALQSHVRGLQARVVDLAVSRHTHGFRLRQLFKDEIASISFVTAIDFRFDDDGREQRATETATKQSVATPKQDAVRQAAEEWARNRKEIEKKNLQEQFARVPPAWQGPPHHAHSYMPDSAQWWGSPPQGVSHHSRLRPPAFAAPGPAAVPHRRPPALFGPQMTNVHAPQPQFSYAAATKDHRLDHQGRGNNKVMAKLQKEEEEASATAKEKQREEQMIIIRREMQQRKEGDTSAAQVDRRNEGLERQGEVQEVVERRPSSSTSVLPLRTTSGGRESYAVSIPGRDMITTEPTARPQSPLRPLQQDEYPDEDSESSALSDDEDDEDNEDKMKRLGLDRATLDKIAKELVERLDRRWGPPALPP